MKGECVCGGFRGVLYTPQELVESGEIENTFPKTVSLEHRQTDAYTLNTYFSLS